MRMQSGKNFLGALAGMILLAAFAWASDHHQLNGTWVLEPTRSDFHGQPAIQTGQVTINDRQHNIYISRNFNYDGANESYEYKFSIDGRENSGIHAGKSFKSKAKWDDNILKVTTIENGATTVEHYSMAPDGGMMLLVERPGKGPLTLFFHRQ